jgi:hypothetical protein
MLTTSFPHLSGLFEVSWLFTALAVAQLVITIWLAIAVKKDADSRAVGPDGVFLGSPWLWFVVVLVTGGYLATLAYWIIHYSSFRFRHE